MAPRLTIKLSGAYRLESRLDKLLEGLAPMIALREETDVRLDCRGLVSFGPAALALVVAVLKDAKERNVIADGSKITMPKSPAVRNYVPRMDLLKVLWGEERYEKVAEPFKRRHAESFRPVREFVTPDECRAVARDLTDALVANCDTDDVARASIRICLDELTENVIHHADAPMGGFAAAQGWKKSATFEIGIVDLGIGIRTSLSKNPRYADISDDVTAIEAALEPRVTSTPERNAGIGLFITKLLLRENGGVLMVRSGGGAVYSGSREGSSIPATAFPGTMVALKARTDRPLNINEVYRALEEDDGDATDGDD